MNKTLDSQWQDFEKNVMPKDAPTVQRREMRRAFYAGAICFFELINNASSEYFTEEEGATAVDALFEECMETLRTIDN